MIDHDRLFKELISNFFPEFIELFFPEIAADWQPESIEFLPQEVFTDVTTGEKKIIDLLVKVSWKNQDSLFIIHVEHESSARGKFNRRMFKYFARLHEKYGLPVYPIVIYSHDKPLKPQPNSYRIELGGWTILEFNYRVIQLNNLHWQDYVNYQNPVASALIAKMQKSETERPFVKLAALASLVNLGLNPAQVQLISGFIDTYLRLDAQEKAVFDQQLANMGLGEEEKVMQIVTSWMEEGIEIGLERGLQQGLERGLQQGELKLMMRQLKRRFGVLSTQLQERIQGLSVDVLEELGEALLDFAHIADLEAWLDKH